MNGREVDGLDVVDSTGVVTGNADLPGTGVFEGVPETADGHAAPLPIYPLPSPQRLALCDLGAILLLLAMGALLGKVFL
ncbi:MAG: hypothetical protein J7507_11960 [Pseudoxanthomonas sp.]|nr:hypothetical protein [Pseudoxanthomonas sp.]